MHDPVSLQRRVKELEVRYPDAKSDVVAEVVVSILSSMSGDMSAREAALLHEIGTLGQAVADAELEIAAFRVDDITTSYIPCATDELDAIVTHTAAATESILEVCETLDALGTAVDGTVHGKLQDATVRIYEACSFQDLTGQRITKVVATLKTIDRTIARIVDTFGIVTAPADPSKRPRKDGLLNGSQLPAATMDQSDIDKLLASFD